MKVLYFFVTACIFFNTGLFAQTTDVNVEADVSANLEITKLQQPNVERVITKENEAALYKATAALIKKESFKNFTILTGWYKQTRTHYYYQIGWNINGRAVLQLVKYRWKDGAVSITDQEEVEADTDVVTAAEATQDN